MQIKVAVLILFLSFHHTCQQSCKISDTEELTLTIKSPYHNPSKETYSIVALFPAKLKGKYDLSGFVWMEAAKFAFLEMLERMKELSTVANLELVIYDTCDNINLAVAYAVSLMLDAEENDRTLSCCERKLRRNVIGFVGPAFSELTRHFVNLFPESYPFISYTATSIRFNDKRLYPTFMRTIPPDNFQANLIVDLLKHYKWTYVSIVAYDDDYGREGTQELKRIFGENNICTAVETLFKTRCDMKRVVKDLQNKNQSNVVILWAPGSKGHNFLKESVQMKLRNKIFILSDSLGRNPNISKYDLKYIHGLINIVSDSNPYTKFEGFFREISYINYGKNNPWMKRFYEKYVNISGDDYNISLKHFWNLLPMSKVGNVRNAIYAFGHAIKNYINDSSNNCTRGKEPRDCLKALTENRDEFFTKYLQKVQFMDKCNLTMKFDEKGNPSFAHYIITSLQYTANRLVWKDIGSWKNKRAKKIEISNSSLSWTGYLKKTPKSSCGNLCNPGFSPLSSSKSCCWTCIPCKGETIKTTKGQETCQPCSNGTYANKQHTECVSVKYTYSTITGMAAVFMAIQITINLGLCIFITTVFMRFRSTPVVQSSQFQLSLMQLFFLLLCNIVCVGQLTKPTKTLCISSTFSLPFFTTLAITPTLLKTQRLITIFNARSRLVKRAYIQLKDALKIVTLLCIQSALFVMTYFFSNMSGSTGLELHTLTERDIQIGCDISLMFYTQVSFLLIIFMVCGVVTFKARELPTNYNETRNIAYTMFLLSLCVSFAIIVHASLSDLRSKTIVVVLITLTGDCIIILCLYTQKLWVILFRPELNTSKEFIANRIQNISDHIEQEMWSKAASKQVRQSFRQRVSSFNSTPLMIYRGNKMVDEIEHNANDNHYSQKCSQGFQQSLLPSTSNSPPRHHLSPCSASEPFLPKETPSNTFKHHTVRT